jgi:aryl-alcohol dehydrogenase-like predicted oxidoreductase
MEYRTLGRSGLRVSVLAFGAGPVSGLMTGADAAAQRATVARALAAGVNWFDTAPGYGDGRSESNLGRVLKELDAAESVHVATKVRLTPDHLSDAAGHVRSSVEASRTRLGVPRISLLQLHNGLTRRRGDEPSSLAPEDVLDAGGVLAAFRAVQDAGLVDYLGLTATGHPDALREVVRSGGFHAVQVPYNLLNPSAGRLGPVEPPDVDYGNILADCAEGGLGALAIRVFAGGALLGHPPSAHTLRTPYFPLALYEHDARRAQRLAAGQGGPARLRQRAVRFALGHPAVHAAIIGFGGPAEVDEAVATLPGTSGGV